MIRDRLRCGEFVASSDMYAVKLARNTEQRGAMSSISGLQKGRYAQTTVMGGSDVVIVMTRPRESTRSHPGMSQVNLG